MSTEKEQNQTKENQFRLQRYVWWPWSTKVRVIAIAIVTLAFVLGTPIKIKPHPMGDKKEGDNIQWLVDWMKSPESQNKLMNLRCKRVNDDELRCTREPEEGNGHAENSKQSQRFSLRLDDLKGDQNQSENSLCCRPCRHSPSKPIYKIIYDWLFKNAGGRDIVDNNCKYYSVTLSNKFEYELKRMLEYELQLLQKNTEFQKLIPKCKTNLFTTDFHNILNETLKEVQKNSTTTSKVFDIPMDKIKFPNNFTLSREGGYCPTASRTSVPCKTLASFKTPTAPKEDSSDDRTSTSVEVGSLPSIGKGERVMGNLSSAPDNNLLNATEVGVDSTPASITGMLCSKIFNGVPDVSNPRLLAVICNLTSATKQQSAYSSRSLETIGDNLKELLLMSLSMFMDIDARNRSLQSFIDHRVEKVRPEENLATTAVCCEHTINLMGQVAELTRQLEELREKVVQSSQSTSTAKSQ